MSSCQGVGYDLISLTAGCGRLRELTIGLDSLLDILLELYVLEIQARCNLFDILLMNYLEVLSDMRLNHQPFRLI